MVVCVCVEGRGGGRVLAQGAHAHLSKKKKKKKERGGGGGGCERDLLLIFSSREWEGWGRGGEGPNPNPLKEGWVLCVLNLYFRRLIFIYLYVHWDLMRWEIFKRWPGWKWICGWDILVWTSNPFFLACLLLTSDDLILVISWTMLNVCLESNNCKLMSFQTWYDHCNY